MALAKVGNVIETLYFSGQGIVLIANRDPTTGAALGFRNVGNVSALAIAVEQNTIDHKESTTGNRATDKRLTEETQLNFTATFEDFSKENLALATFGDASEIAAGTATTEILKDGNGAELGRTNPLINVNVSSVVVTGTGGTPTYVEGDNYEVDTAGSIFIYTDATQTLKGAAANITEGEAIEIDYTFTKYNRVQALTQGRKEVWIRFEGLNTITGEGGPVVVDIYKVDMDPLTELALINDEFAELELEGFALADQKRLTGSKFFTIDYTQNVTNLL